MSGSGELNKSRQPNYFIYDKSNILAFPLPFGAYSKELFFLAFELLDTSLAELEDAVRGFLNRDDIAILLIVQYVADMVRHIIENYHKLTPAILEIPSKEHAYDASKDFILKRAQVSRSRVQLAIHLWSPLTLTFNFLKKMFSAEDFK